MKSATDPSVMRVGSAPGRVPLLGHLAVMALQPFKFLRDLPSHGDLVEIKLGHRQAYIVCHPYLLHQVYRNSRVFDKGGTLFEQARAFSGNGLFNCEHQEHSQLDQEALG